MRTITIQVTDQQYNMLRLLAQHPAWRPFNPDAQPEKGLEDLLERLQDGIFRPGTWEAPAVRTLLGDGFLKGLEPDPEQPHRLRIKGP